MENTYITMVPDNSQKELYLTGSNSKTWKKILFYHDSEILLNWETKSSKLRIIPLCMYYSGPTSQGQYLLPNILTI